MGKHFDTLVEIVKKGMIRQAIYREHLDVDRFISGFLADCGIFEMPIRAIDLKTPPEGYERTYDEYLIDFIRLSGKYDRLMVTPHRKTVIEDSDSMVYMKHIEGTRFHIITVLNHNDTYKDLEHAMIEAGIVDFHDYGSSGFRMNSIGLYTGAVDKGRLKEINIKDKYFHDPVAKDLGMAALAYFKQDAYIMDPANFIIERESNASIKQRHAQSKKSKKKKQMIQKPNKTVMRPHYLILPSDETTDFLKGSSHEPRPFRPVIGYFKTLKAECFTRMRGQTIHIEQYYRGEAEIDGMNGWHYKVLLKDKDFNIVPFTRRCRTG